MPDGKPKLTLVEEKVKEVAKEIAPCYPNIENVDAWEQLWAIRASYEGVSKANGDLHKLIKGMQEQLGWDFDDVLNFEETLK